MQFADYLVKGEAELSFFLSFNRLKPDDRHMTSRVCNEVVWSPFF